jgi:Mlc titration factor MtfA (ptsG expression regulator)
MLFQLWFKDWRRRRLVRRPTPAHWPGILEQRLWYWGYLSAPQQQRLLGLIAIFLKEKEVVVPAGIAEPEAVRLTVAGAACLMLLGFEDTYCFDRIQTIVLTLRPFRQQVQVAAVDGLFGDMLASGAYSRNAPVALSWRDVQRECATPEFGANVVIHEFAHHIDDLDGAMAGDPPFPTLALVGRWKEVSRREFERLNELQAAGVETVIDPYGLGDPVEFFAVSCEAFFCNPLGLEEEHAELYGLLQLLFRLDPKPWFGD